MDDLRLYRLLVASETPADPLELTRLLRLLARREPEARRPWIGYVPTYATHGDASVRAAAVSALAGATGRVGVAMIVHALDDGDASVRAEAARALLATATSQPHRIAHLVFHPRPDVRRVMHAAKLSPKMRAIAAHRLADPEFDGDLASLELAATPASIGLVVNLALRARLTKNAASAWLKEGPASAQVSWANAAPAPMRWRILAALVCANAGHWSAEALGLAVFLDARVLTWKRIPLVLRRAATDTLYRHPDPSPIPPTRLTQLMSSDLVRRHGGDLDLRVAGALSLFHRKGRYAWLVEQLGLESIRRAFLRDPEASAPFLSLHDSGEEGRLDDRPHARRGRDAGSADLRGRGDLERDRRPSVPRHGAGRDAARDRDAPLRVRASSGAGVRRLTRPHPRAHARGRDGRSRRGAHTLARTRGPRRVQSRAGARPEDGRRRGRGGARRPRRTTADPP